MRSVGLLREVPERAAGPYLPISVQSGSHEAGQRFGLTGVRDAAVGKGGCVRVHAGNSGQLSSQRIASLEERRAGTGGTEGTTRTRCLRKACVTQLYPYLLRRQAEHFRGDLGEDGITASADIG